jgi:hypothetical protein
MANRELVAAKKNAGQVVKQPANTVAVITKAAVPAVVQIGINDLFLAFPAGVQQAPQDRIRAFQLYIEAVEGFERVVVEEALYELRFNNPRNPFPPSAQDVHERCAKVNAKWYKRVRSYYLGDAQYRYRGIGHWEQEWGAAPGQLGFCISEHTIVKWVGGNGGLSSNDIVELSDAQFAGLPDALFGPGDREKMLAERKHSYFRKLQERVACHFLDWPGDSIVDRRRRGATRWCNAWGPAPLQPGCKAPDAVVIEALRDFIHARSHADEFMDRLNCLTDEMFNAIPAAAFPEGIRERCLAQREFIRQERERVRQERELEKQKRELDRPKTKYQEIVEELLGEASCHG